MRSRAPAPPGLGAVGEGPTQGRGKGPGRRRGASRYLCAPGAPTGHAFPAPDADYERFAGAFPFEETDDQERAIAAVLEDMTAARAMDRLVCGDVGWETEVAMRAAYLAVAGERQVAVLVPTTLLAQQHFETFSDRFADWPVRVEVLSRFRSTSEAAVADRLKAGKIDIIVGTHKLLSKELEYARLGLIIIDEEHRFGVRQKEFERYAPKWTYSPSPPRPIPRTLNMSMHGLATSPSSPRRAAPID